MFILLALALLVLPAGSFASDPTGCGYPGSLDNFQAYSFQQELTHTDYNKLLCAVNKMQQKINAITTTARRGCTTITNQAPSTRAFYSVSVGALLAGTEAIAADAVDNSNPARLEMDGIQTFTGSSSVTVWVFNRDAGSAHSGKVCVTVTP